MSDRRPLKRTIRSEETLPWDGLTASAQILDAASTAHLIIPPREWQREAWAFYHTLGEMRFAIGTWLANSISRIRLIPAIKHPNDDEPQPVEDGLIVDLVAQLAGGVGGQAEMLSKLAIHLSVPGDSYLVGAEDPVTRKSIWSVYSSDEIRIKSRRTVKSILGESDDVIIYEVCVAMNAWQELPSESFVTRIWNPDPQYGWAATSNSEAALPIMREIDFYNRYIISILLSRLALNGMLLIPQEVTFPAKKNFADAPDPFMAELIDIAKRSIKNPGSASAALPLPLKVPAQYIDQIKHITFDTEVSDKIHENREKALGRLATTLNVPSEVLKGMSDMNHWGQWQMEESAVKIYLSPIIEIICSSLTKGYIQPMYKAASAPLVTSDGGELLVWYDATALIQQPDRGADAFQLYDRGEFSGQALRRETGFSEEDKPKTPELTEIILKKIAFSGDMAALADLTGNEKFRPEPVVPNDNSASDEQPTDENQKETPPATQERPSTVKKTPPDTRPASADVITYAMESHESVSTLDEV